MPEIIRQIELVWSECKSSEVSFENRLRKFEAQAAPFVWDSLKLYRRRSFGSPMLNISYIAAKLVYALNAAAQFLWLNEFLKSPKYPFWGINILRDILKGVDWQVYGHFPRVTHCDFSTRKAAGEQVDTVVCVLTLNVYYEKVFLFLWFWMLLVATLCVLSTVYWLYSLCFNRNASRLIASYVQSIDHSPFLERGVSVLHNSFYSMKNGGRQSSNSDELSLNLFINRQLRSDGLFVLRQVAANLGHLPAAYLTKALYMTASPSVTEEAPVGRRSTRKTPPGDDESRHFSVKGSILHDAGGGVDDCETPPPAFSHQKIV